MSLYEALKDVDKQIEEMEGTAAAPAEKDDKPAAPAEKETAAPENDDKGDKEAAPAKTAAADKPPAEERPDPQGYARLRKEAADAKRDKEAAENRARDLEARLKAPPAAAEQPAAPAKVSADPEPDKNTDPEAHLRWEVRQANAEVKQLKEWREEREKKERYDDNLRVAREQFSDFETQFQSREDAKDYADVANYAVAAIAQSIRIMNPHLTQKQISAEAELQLLRRAGAYQKAGHANPIEALYHEVKNTWGFQPKAAAPAQEETGDGGEQTRGDDGKFVKKAADMKPSIKQISDNKKKSASSLAPGGKSGSSPLTRDGLLKSGVSEWSRLSPEQLRQAEELEGA